jgi:5-methylthioadenosine/S-adenosylhomocysteine deaminase
MMDSVLPHPEDIRRVRKSLLASDDGLVTMAMAARGPEFSTIETVEHDVRLARELGLRVTLHIGLGEKGPKYRGIQRMHEKALLGPDITMVHCCTSSDHEFGLMADTGTTASVSVQMAMIAPGGFGLPATGRLLAHGIRPSLSVDSEMSTNGDMFAEMRAAFAAERMIQFHGLETRTKPVHITALDALEFATLAGARAVGLESKIGSLTPGKDADFILLRSDALNLAPVNDVVGTVVLGGHAGNVDSVFVAGKPVKWAGQLLGVDVAHVVKLATASRAYLTDTVARMTPAR